MQDAKTYAKRCRACQLHSNRDRKPTIEMQHFTPSIPFAQLGMDIVGKLLTSRGGRQYLLVAVDCFTKWGSAVALQKVKVKFVNFFPIK